MHRQGACTLGHVTQVKRFGGVYMLYRRGVCVAERGGLRNMTGGVARPTLVPRHRFRVVRNQFLTPPLSSKFSNFFSPLSF
jgi:hypothetical protein